MKSKMRAWNQIALQALRKCALASILISSCTYSISGKPWDCEPLFSRPNPKNSGSLWLLTKNQNYLSIIFYFKVQWPQLKLEVIRVQARVTQPLSQLGRMLVNFIISETTLGIKIDLSDVQNHLRLHQPNARSGVDWVSEPFQADALCDRIAANYFCMRYLIFKINYQTWLGI